MKTLRALERHDQTHAKGERLLSICCVSWDRWLSSLNQSRFLICLLEVSHLLSLKGPRDWEREPFPEPAKVGQDPQATQLLWVSLESALAKGCPQPSQVPVGLGAGATQSPEQRPSAEASDPLVPPRHEHVSTETHTRKRVRPGLARAQGVLGSEAPAFTGCVLGQVWGACPALL